ncbi:hypothetical protein AAC387_Pa05g1488 [Persea americana]
MDSNKMVAGARACLIELLELVLNAIGIVYDCSNIVRQSERGCFPAHFNPCLWWCFFLPLTIDEIVAVKTNKAVMYRPLQSTSSPDLLGMFQNVSFLWLLLCSHVWRN